MTTLYPMLIKPRFDERIWGGDLLATRLGKDAPRDKLIGESWEVYEENTVLNGEYTGQTIGQLRAVMGHELTGQVDPDQLFPLLTKFIDAHDVLSVQVHPDDHFAQTLEHQRHGKTECWYVLWAEPGSVLTYGFSRDTSPDEYTELVQSGKLDQVLRSLPVKAGDVVYIPAGTVHAIGAGIGVYELQQTSDVTYRIYDWNRRDASGQTRLLHVDQARQVLDYHRWTRGPIQPLSLPGSDRTMLIAGEYFCQELIDATRPRELSTHQSAVAVAALDQPLSIRLAGGDEVVRHPPMRPCWFRPRPAPIPCSRRTATGPRRALWWPTCRPPVRTPRISYGPLVAPTMISRRSWPSSRRPKTWDSRRLRTAGDLWPIITPMTVRHTIEQACV